MKLTVRLTHLKCEQITADDARNPLTGNDSIDFEVWEGEAEAHTHALKRGTLGDWRPGNERDMDVVLWSGQINDGEVRHFKFTDDDLVLDDYLGEFLLRMREDRALEWTSHENCEIIGEEGALTRQVNLTGSGAYYKMTVSAQFEA